MSDIGAACAAAFAQSRLRLTLNQRVILDVLRDGGGYASYDKLVEELWGDGLDAPRDPRGALHCLLSRMRRVLGRDAIQSWHGQGVRLNPAGFARGAGPAPGDPAVTAPHGDAVAPSSDDTMAMLTQLKSEVGTTGTAQ